jgi:PTH2 family peptidyl-tRNA hydrolase
LHQKAQQLGLTCELIKDAGFTEFTEPTYTCLSIGPAKTELINKVTGNLPTLKLKVEAV